jgi:hypothetical protein
MIKRKIIKLQLSLQKKTVLLLVSSQFLAALLNLAAGCAARGSVVG